LRHDAVRRLNTRSPGLVDSAKLAMLPEISCTAPSSNSIASAMSASRFVICSFTDVGDEEVAFAKSLLWRVLRSYVPLPIDLFDAVKPP
jgi:hypothetical protein